MSYIVGVPAGLGGDPLIPVQNIHGLRRVGGATRGVIREEADACQIGDPGFCRRGCFADCWSGPPRLMVLWGLQKASAGISFDALVAALRATSPTALLGSLAATFLSFAALLGYDLSGLRYAGARPPFTAAFLASFCGFAIGNTVGLGAFSGGAVRYRLYSAAGLSPGQIARIILFIAIAFGIGLATITALGLVLRADEVSRLLGAPAVPLRSAAAVILALAIVFLSFCAVRRRPLRLGPVDFTPPGAPLVLTQIGLT